MDILEQDHLKTYKLLTKGFLYLKLGAQVFPIRLFWSFCSLSNVDLPQLPYIYRQYYNNLIEIELERCIYNEE